MILAFLGDGAGNELTSSSLKDSVSEEFVAFSSMVECLSAKQLSLAECCQNICDY